MRSMKTMRAPVATVAGCILNTPVAHADEKTLEIPGVGKIPIGSKLGKILGNELQDACRMLVLVTCVLVSSTKPVEAAGLTIGIPGLGKVEIPSPKKEPKGAKKEQPQGANQPPAEQSSTQSTAPAEAPAGPKNSPQQSSEQGSFPPGTGPGTAVFKTVSQRDDTILEETSGERLSMAFSNCHRPSRSGRLERVCGSFYSWSARECGGELLTGNVLKDGSLSFSEVTYKGNCEQHNCKIVLLPGWGEYQRVCGKRVVAGGRFDLGRNVELFADFVDKATFYKNADADAVAAQIPPPPYRLEHDAAKFSTAAKAVPAAAKTFAQKASSFPPEGIDLRDILDALVTVESGEWKFDKYIPGSIHDVKSSRTSEGLVVDAKLVHNSVLTNNSWAADTMRVIFKPGQMACIMYWNNHSCSANYAIAVSPSADTALSAADQACIVNVSQEYTEVTPSTCAVWDPKRRECGMETEAKVEQKERRIWKNACKRSLSVVFNCQSFFRKLVTFEPGQTYMAFCSLERAVSLK